MEEFTKSQAGIEMKDGCCWETILHGSSFPACFLNRTFPECLFKNVCINRHLQKNGEVTPSEGDVFTVSSNGDKDIFLTCYI